MGREKPLQTVGGVTLIERAAAALGACVENVLLVTNRPDLYGFLDLPIVEDLVAGRGPLSGLAAAASKLRGERALVVAADYPFLEPDALRRILSEDPVGGVVVPHVDGHPHPLCALYAPEALAAAQDSLDRGELMVMSLLARLPQTIVPQSELGGPAASRVFFNVNTPEDLDRAEEMLAQAQAQPRQP
jgi:molybdopterin-guanine dinucleotide biosynthesis protein A